MLRREGFRRTGSTFRVERSGDVGIINIQSSLSSTRSRLKVTANIAVSLAVLRRWFDEDPDGTPHYSAGHWVQRLGHLTPARDDVWWLVESIEPPSSELSDFVGTIRDYGIPEVRRHMSAEELRDIYLAGPYPFLPEIRRLSYLVVLVAELGPRSRFESLADELLKCVAAPASRHTAAFATSWEESAIELVTRARRLVL